MKKGKIVVASVLTALLSVPVLSGCFGKKNNTPDPEPVQPEGKEKIDFSIAINSGRNQFEVGVAEKIVLLGDKINEDGRSFSFESSDPTVASVDANGNITPLKAGSVYFRAIETSSNSSAELANEIQVLPAANKATGGFNYSAANDIATRTEILGKLEKYVMDAHLTGITLFDNGGYVKYNKPRVHLGTENYITGYGFGLLREGYLEGGTISEPTEAYRDYYHTAFSQDPMTINAMNESGSQVSDLSSYISSAYYGTKMASNKKEYEWYPLLAKDEVYKPTVDGSGNVTGNASTKSKQERPIPLEAHNDLGLYKKWRIYVKTGATEGIKYRFDGDDSTRKSTFDGRNVDISDYEFIYQFLLTGKNGMSRGSEMAGDTSYGIKGALKFFNDTLTETNQANIDKKWNDMKNSGELGVKAGTDGKGQEYIDLELINPVDEFTAMYTLSSSLVSPLPRAFFEDIGGGKIIDAALKYGNFNGEGDDKICNYVLSVGPYRLTSWKKNQLIIFSRNDSWYEVNSTTYRIKGIYQRLIDTSEDTELVYSEFTKNNNLDVCGIPISKIATERNQDDVYQTKGDSTFKLNVNSCTQEQWDDLFGPNGRINKGSSWEVKPWMSNSNFLDGLFFSINRKQFAEKRGVQPSINYFSDAYLSDPERGESYNDSQAHKDAVKNYHSVGADGVDNYGYDYGRAVQAFRAAVNELSMTGKLVKGTKSNPLEIKISVCWMYPTDVQEYGEDIAYYFEQAFNDDAVCGGTVKLKVKNEYVTDWQDVYNKRMKIGQFDLGFGAISGNTYNPLNFLEVLKTDNSSTFTLNWGEDTAKFSEKNPIYYNGKKWSFDALWSCADHGGIARDGVNVEPVQKCYKGAVSYQTAHEDHGPSDKWKGGDEVYQLGKGWTSFEVPLEFEVTDHVSYELNRVVVNAAGIGNVTDGVTWEWKDSSHKVLKVTISEAAGKTISEGIRDNVFKDDEKDGDNEWKQNPFLISKYDELWAFGIYYTMTIEGSRPNENYYSVKINKNAQ